jgi:hypothetical protein
MCDGNLRLGSESERLKRVPAVGLAAEADRLDQSEGVNQIVVFVDNPRPVVMPDSVIILFDGFLP